MNKICPTCGTVVTVEGKTTLYYWCSNCQKAVDPITNETPIIIVPSEKSVSSR